MYNITLIGTIHSENGQCNPDELYKILEEINPEVIFDELPPHEAYRYYSESFDKYCVNQNLLNRHPPEVPLEVKCVKRYMGNYDVDIFPIDIDLRQKLSKYQEDVFFMIQTFFKDDDYKKLDKENDALIAQEGFDHLNSDKFLDFLDKKEVLEQKIMESDVQKDKLLDIYKLLHAEQIDNRENAMLESIYNYSKENQYNQAVLLIGAQHRKSIKQKITEYEKLSEIKLNWTMYTDRSPFGL